MIVPSPRFLTVALSAAAIHLAPAAAYGETTRVVITHCANILEGKSFGRNGPYEKCEGKIYFSLDPDHPRNQIIVDLGKAPRNVDGRVEFSSDLWVLRPKDPSRGNGVLLFDVVNRGGKLLLGRFNLARSSADPTTQAEFGDGFLMREGYTLVAVGWEATPRNRAVSLYPPVATDDGTSIMGSIRGWWIPLEASREFDLTSSYWTGFEEYPPLDSDDDGYRLTERVGYHGQARAIPREAWQFGRAIDGEVVYHPSSVFLWTGFSPGRTYELMYETKDPIVAGVGFAAIRDAASYFKYDPDAPIRGDYAYAYGVSQTGRYLRQMVFEGFTVDESDRKALDAVMVHMGGASLGSFNERFARPNEGGFHSETRFPFLYQTTQDPATGKEDGIGARISDGLEPKLFLVETSSEYWDRGRVAALNHVSIDGGEDVQLPENVRFYMFSSLPHATGPFPPEVSFAQQGMGNPIDPRPVMRALLVALDRWVREDVEPPVSRHPTLAGQTLISQGEIGFPAIPGIQWPYDVRTGYRADLAGPLIDHPLPFLVPAVDRDGNEIDGIRLPDVAVPLGTYTGWAFRSARAGEPNEVLSMPGGFIPFPRTRAERERWGDPRPSVEERYPDRADYVRRLEEAARQMMGERLLLDEDFNRAVDGAESLWDWLLDASEETLQPG